MHLDVQDLRKFYYRTGLGRVAQSVMAGHLRERWSDTGGQTVIGFGFAAPLLRPFLGEARRVMALMPGPQGVVRWPARDPNIAILCEETLWPLQMGQADRLVMLHGLETCESPSALLEEAWRALAPGGRAIFFVPNRTGMWSRRDASPFGYGRPYSLSQLEAQLRAHSFTPELHRAMLYSPPSHRRFWLRTAPAIEKSGRRLASFLAGGVLMVEATKQVYAPRQKGSTSRITSSLRGLEGRPVPVAGRDSLG